MAVFSWECFTIKAESYQSRPIVPINRYFEDLEVGETARSKPMRVERQDLLEYANKYDPQPFHADEDLATESVFDDVIAPGTYTAALWRLLDHQINGDIAYVCGFGWDEVRWPIPVRPDDNIYATSEILELRDASKKDRGHALYLYQVINQREQVVMSFRSHNLVYKKTR